MFWRRRKKLPDEIRRVHLLPDDMLVLKAQDPLDCQAVERLAAKARAVVPGHQIMALDSGLDFEVISRPHVPWPDWRWPAKA